MAEPTSLSGILAGIPGYRGYMAAAQNRQQMEQADQTTQLNKMNLSKLFGEQQDEQQLKQVMAQSGNDPKVMRQMITEHAMKGNAKAQELYTKLAPIWEKQDGLSKPKWSVTERYNEQTGMPEKILMNENDPTQTMPFGGQKSKEAGGSNAAPYVDFLPTEQGYVVGDKRSGSMRRGSIDGQPVIPAQWNPNLNRDIAAAKEYGKAVGEQRGLLPNQKEALISVQKAKELLSQGIYAGGYAKLKMAGAKYTPGVDTDKAARTEEFISHIGNTVVPRLKEFGGSDTVEEMNYLREIMGGNITLEASALKRILDQVEAKIQRGIDRVSRGLTPDGQPAGQSTQQTQPKRIKFDAQGNVVQ